MNGRDLGRAWRTDDGGGPSSKHRLTVIQSFVIAWDSSSIRAARSSAPSNTIRSPPVPSVMVVSSGRRNTCEKPEDKT